MFISSPNGSGGFLSIYPLQRQREVPPNSPQGESGPKTSGGSANGALTRTAITQVAEMDTRQQATGQQGRPPETRKNDANPSDLHRGGGQTSADAHALGKKVQQALVAFTIGVKSDDPKSSPSALQEFLNSLPEDVRQKWESFINGQIVTAPATPQQAASQVAHLALGDFGVTGSPQDNRAARQQFAEQVRPSINQGFEAAAKTVDSIGAQQALKQIHALVLDHVNSFIGVDLTA